MNKLFTTIFALTVSCATVSSMAQELKGDVKAGESKNAMCIGCHGITGYQASFPEVYKVPMISGQSEKYIASSLNAYKKGERKHPTMRGVAEALSDQDIADLSAYYAASGQVSANALPDKPGKEAGAAVQALLGKANCASCHGANFAKPIDPSYPKLAGQHADYLYASLKAYHTDGNKLVGRSNATMRSQVVQEADGKRKLTFSNAELKQIASYLASLPGELKVVPQSRFR